MEYYNKNSVDSIINNFGDEDIQKAIHCLEVYSQRVFEEDVEDKEYQWKDVKKLIIFMPVFSDNDIFMRREVLYSATCPACGARITIDDYDNFCPRCGASMTYVENL